MAAALGIGLRPGDVAVSLGTSGTVYTVADAPTADVTGAVAGFADATGRYLPLVCTLNATKVTDTVAALLGVDHAGLDALALAAAPGAGGLVLLPYLDGERTPDRPGATGVLAGLRRDVGRGDVARAAVEGVVCGLLDGLDALGAVAPVTGGALHLVGGGARSAAYRQVLADLTGRPVLVPAGDEHVALGACVQAAAVLHGRPPLEVAAAWAGASPGATEVTEPGPGAAAAAEVRAAYAARRDREA
jgi:xylulokinase